MCGFIAGVLVLIFVFVSTSNFLQQNPEYWWVVFLILGVIAIGLYLLRRMKIENNRLYLLRIADELEAIIANFASMDTYLSLQKGEKAIYERGGVQLREYKGTGSSFQSGNAGVIVRATNNIGVTLGGSRGSLTPNPEQQTVIDVGTLIFTNQRILFAGPNHAREWEFSKLINFSTGDNGFVADIAVSNRPRVSAIAADSQHGITPGIMASICIDLFQDGEDKARATAQELIDGIRSIAAESSRKK
jgi:hypothetical protein